MVLGYIIYKSMTNIEKLQAEIKEKQLEIELEEKKLELERVKNTKISGVVIRKIYVDDYNYTGTPVYCEPYRSTVVC